MIDLKTFPKIGVRVPASLRRSVKQLALDMEAKGVGFLGKDMTMEAIFAVAVLELLAMPESEKLRAFSLRLPELIALFEAEIQGKGREGTTE